MKHIVDYIKFNEDLDYKMIDNVLRTEREIYTNYFVNTCNMHITNQGVGTGEDDISFMTCDLMDSDLNTIHIQPSFKSPLNKTLFLKLYDVGVGFIETFIIRETLSNDNLSKLFKTSLDKGFSINFSLDVNNSYYEHLYNDMFYLNILDTIIDTEEWYEALPTVIDYYNDEMVLKWWSKISNHEKIYKITNKLKKTKIWNRLSSLLGDALKTGSDMGEMGF